MSSLKLAIEHVIAVERDRSTQGVPLVIIEKSFNRDKLIRRIIEHVLGGGYDPATSDSPTALVCTRKYNDAERLMNALNPKLLAGMHGRLLRHNTQQRRIGPLTFGSYGALASAPLDTDAFDFLIINAHTPGEFERFRDTFAALEPAFTVLIMPKSMHSQGELEHWPHLEVSYAVRRPPTQRAAPSEA